MRLAQKAWETHPDRKYSIRANAKVSNTLGDVRNFKNFRQKSITADSRGFDRLPNPRNYLMSHDDFIFVNPLKTQSNGIQPIIINEFQPNVMFYESLWKSALFESFINLTGVKAMTDAVKSAFAIEKTKQQFLSATKSNDLLKQYSRNPEELYDKNALENTKNDLLLNPIQMIREMFDSGTWLNTYELPFFNNNYLSSNNNTYWTVNRT